MQKRHTPEYRAWNNIKTRCHNPRFSQFKDYGGKGIYLCEQWRHDFPAFLAEIGYRPSRHHTIDRIDNTRGYEPGNVRWATRQEQARNRSDNRLITFQGETLTMSDWASRLGVGHKTLAYRLDRGWPIDIALTKPAVLGNRVIRGSLVQSGDLELAEAPGPPSLRR